MTNSNPDHVRLAQLLRLVEKEDVHLQAVRNRLMPQQEKLDKQWLDLVLKDDVGIDRLESFSAKFARMQDTIIDKLLPQLLKTAGETPFAAIDNLNRAERLGFISHTDAWLEMRGLRNRLVHEYIESLDEMIPALKRANAFTDELHNTFTLIAEYANTHLGIQPQDIT